MLKLVSLDLETTGTDIDAGAVPIQIGVAIRTDDGHRVATEQVMISPRDCDQQYTWSARAEEVHGVDRQRSEQRGSKPFVAGARIITFLDDYNFFASSKMDRWPLGWNVGSFDMPFVQRYLPALADVLSYRTLDLNAAVATMAALDGLDLNKVKNAAKAYAENMILEQRLFRGSDGVAAWHDAEWDALAALLSFEFLTDAHAET